MNMDERVTCMACLVAGKEGIVGLVATEHGVTHALARTKAGILYFLCAFNNEGWVKLSMFWTSSVNE